MYVQSIHIQQKSTYKNAVYIYKRCKYIHKYSVRVNQIYISRMYYHRTLVMSALYRQEIPPDLYILTYIYSRYIYNTYNLYIYHLLDTPLVSSHLGDVCTVQTWDFARYVDTYIHNIYTYRMNPLYNI